MRLFGASRTPTWRYARRLGHRARLVEGWVSALIGLITTAVAISAGWRFGVSWGVVSALGLLLVLAAWAGRDIQRELDEATSVRDRATGTLIPSGWNAIVHGEQDSDGEWVPPGYRVLMSPGPVTDDHGNAILGGTDNRIFGGRGNTVAGSNSRIGSRPW